MKKAFQSGSLAAALLAASGQAFQTTVKQQISTNFAQAEVQHHITIIDGELLPCRDSVLEELIVCPEGQFVWRTLGDGNVDCPCRYVMRHCDNEFEEFDTLTGECTCVERPCHDNHFFDFNQCKCACDICNDCDPGFVWDRNSCSCICEPQQHPTEPEKYTWNIAQCELECIIQDCPNAGDIWDQNICECKCEPLACPEGFEWNQTDCECQCTSRHHECHVHQYFDSETCSCLCAPRECAASHYFDTEICNCVCAEPTGAEACESDFYWNNKTCKCECNPAVADTCVDGEQFLDVDDCTCKCAPTECTNGLIFNESICQCVCCPQQCPDNFFFNSHVDHCACECAPVDCPANFYWNQDHCKCDCMISDDCPTDGINNYYFDAEECMCKCSGPVVSCSGETPVYDTELCSCVCAPQNCGEGLSWSVVDCQCVCNPEICPETQYFRTDLNDATKCGCFCRPHFCKVGYHWDEEICNCVCSPPTGDYACPEDYFWDSVACRCRCVPLDCSAVTPYSIYDVESESCKCVEDPADLCLAGTYFDHLTCSCLCAPNQACGDGFYWDTRECGCLPEHCQCPVGFYYSFETDNCECLTQVCAQGFEWNSQRCSCQHEDAPCPPIDGVEYFFDPSSGLCRCIPPTTAAPIGETWDMEQCAFVPCQECTEEGYYYNTATGECECAFQPPYTENGIVYTFDTTRCAFVCAIQDCVDDSYYWDANQCKCACYIQQCDRGYVWDSNSCMCICLGEPLRYVRDNQWHYTSTNECPCGMEWNPDCCACEPCQDRGLCSDTEFFNPSTCSCTCLPQCCDDTPNSEWDYESCACVNTCSEAGAVYQLLQTPGFTSNTVTDPTGFTLAFLTENGVVCGTLEIGSTGQFYLFDPKNCECYDPGENDEGCEGGEAQAVFNLIQSGYCNDDILNYAVSLGYPSDCFFLTKEEIVDSGAGCNALEVFEGTIATGVFYSFDTAGCKCYNKGPDPTCTETKAVCDFVGSIPEIAWDASLQNWIPYMTCQELSPYDPICAYFNENIEDGYPLTFDPVSCACLPTGGPECTESRAIIKWINQINDAGIAWVPEYQNNMPMPMPWEIPEFATCSMFNAMVPGGVPLIFDETDCICYSPCDFENYPQYYQFDLCHYFQGGLHWNGCEIWLEMTMPGAGDLCQPEDDVFSTKLNYHTQTNQVWRFYDDLAWRATNDANPAATMNDTPLVASEEYPEGPQTEDEMASWQFGFEGLDSHFRPGDAWFNQVGETYYYKIRNDERASADQGTCSDNWIGFDSASCSAASDEVDARPVGTSDAAMIKFTLHQAPIDMDSYQYFFDANGDHLYPGDTITTADLPPCYFWTAQISDPNSACDGFYLDQNQVFSQITGLYSKITKFVRTRNMFALQFSNSPLSMAGVNAYNLNVPYYAPGPLFYHDFYTMGKFQIPMQHLSLGDGEIFQHSQYCNCVDGACDRTIWS